MKINRSVPRGLGLFLLVLAVGAPWETRAQTAWTNTLGGNWSAPGNWNPGVVPGTGTNVFITNTFGSVYTVTNDLLNATLGDLVQYNSGAGTVTLLINTNGFNPTGDAIFGQRGVLNLNSFDALIGGSLTVSNLGSVILRGAGAELSVLGGGLNSGTILITTNAIFNVGGTDTASANASSATFTNTGTITFGRFTNTLNASTATVGIFNQGTIKNDQVAPVPISFVNAVVLNDVGGVIQTGGSISDRMFFHAIPTNRGAINLGVNAAVQVNSGDLVNEGSITWAFSAGNHTLAVTNGNFINATNGLVRGAVGALNAKSILNRGTVIVSNNVGSGLVFSFGGPLTNEGTMLVYRPFSAAFNDRTLAGQYIVNKGTITAIGTGTLLTSNLPVNAMTINTTNLASGTIISSNASLTVFDTTSHGGKLRNLGTLRVESNSVMAVGGFLNASEGAGKITVGLRGFLNEGTITLNDGLFAVSVLTNAATAALEGRGEVGRAQFTNMVSGSLATTNFVRQFSTVNIINAGTIAPDGTLNVGIITNLAGGQIVGFGTIQSVNVTNYYVGETLIASNYNTGARIQNNSGATILASGGTLVLSNGLTGNLNVGTIGATNSGILQLGDGTLALTNNGTISVHNGGLHLGSLRNNGTIQIVGSVVTFSNTVVNAGRYISDPSTNIFVEDVTVTEPGTLEGWIGDLFDFKKSLLITSTNKGQFYLSYSTVQFSGGGVHTNVVTGLEMGGTNEAPFFVENFAYGVLRLGSASDQVFFTNFVGAVSNTALYAYGVDLLGDTNNVANLHSPFNIYYAFSGLNPNNAYLGDLSYELEGGGWLLPAIPEPGATVLLLVAGAAFLRRRR